MTTDHRATVPTYEPYPVAGLRYSGPRHGLVYTQQDRWGLRQAERRYRDAVRQERPITKPAAALMGATLLVALALPFVPLLVRGAGV